MPNITTQEKVYESLSANIRRINDEEKDMVCGMLEPRLHACEADSAVISFAPGPWADNARNMAHGGIIATMLDTAMGLLSFAVAGDRSTSTVSMHISYLRPVPLDRRFVVRARVSKSGRTLVNISAEAWMEGEPDRLVATAGGIFYVAQGSQQGKN